jgi:hypothetical protein
MAAENHEKRPTKMLQSAGQKAACGGKKRGWGDSWNDEAQQNATEQTVHAPLADKVCSPIVPTCSFAEIHISFVTKLNKSSPQRVFTLMVGLSAACEGQG